MKNVFTLFSVLVDLLHPLGAFPHPHSDLGGSRTGRFVSCRGGLEFPHDGMCCLNCEPGEYVKLPCTEDGKKGMCEECHLGTFTEHANGLNQCFRCSQCLPDQDLVRPCSPTQDSVCQCKPGGFCHPDEACEVCKKCSRCKSDEETVRNCTSTTDTVCKKTWSESRPSSDTSVIYGIVSLFVLAVLCGAGVVWYMWRKRRRTSDPQRSSSDRLKPGPGYTEVSRTSSTDPVLPQPLMPLKQSADVEDERRMLCESCCSSTSNSQHSLAGLHCSGPSTSPPWVGSRVPPQPSRRSDELLPDLIPVNGVESLRSCFDFFGELDMDYHKRFFRGLNLNDNVMKSKEHLPYEDKVNELLNVWVEQRGRDASLNDLLKVLLDLNQRTTAEMIRERALQCGHYSCEC